MYWDANYLPALLSDRWEHRTSRILNCWLLPYRKIGDNNQWVWNYVLQNQTEFLVEANIIPSSVMHRSFMFKASFTHWESKHHESNLDEAERWHPFPSADDMLLRKPLGEQKHSDVSLRNSIWSTTLKYCRSSWMEMISLINFLSNS